MAKFSSNIPDSTTTQSKTFALEMLSLPKRHHCILEVSYDPFTCHFRKWEILDEADLYI